MSEYTFPSLEVKDGENMMVCACSNDFPALFAVLRWTLCDLFNLPREKWEAADDAIVKTAWANEAMNGEELQQHNKALRKALKELGDLFIPEMDTAVDALSCVIQIFNRQDGIIVASVVGSKTATLTVMCDTTELSPYGPSGVLEVISEKILRITLRNQNAK